MYCGIFREVVCGDFMVVCGGLRLFAVVCGISVDRSETASTEYRQIEFHRRYICFHSVDLSTSYKEVYAYKGVDT